MIRLVMVVLTLAGCGENGEEDLVIDIDMDGWPAELDCNDEDENIHPDADEICDNWVDNDCDGLYDDDDDSLDETTAFLWYFDADSDGAGSQYDWILSCLVQEGYAAIGNDCDDNNAERSPSLPEICDGIDNDCDQRVDDRDGDVELGPENPSCWPDTDMDGYGDYSVASDWRCECGDDMVENGLDCNDDHIDMNPDGVANSTSDAYGSYDWNCDALQTSTNDLIGACSVNKTLDGCDYAEGWFQESPACGHSGLWMTDCQLIGVGAKLGCVPQGTDIIQSCI